MTKLLNLSGFRSGVRVWQSHVFLLRHYWFYSLCNWSLSFLSRCHEASQISRRKWQGFATDTKKIKHSPHCSLSLSFLLSCFLFIKKNRLLCIPQSSLLSPPQWFHVMRGTYTDTASLQTWTRFVRHLHLIDMSASPVPEDWEEGNCIRVRYRFFRFFPLKCLPFLLWHDIVRLCKFCVWLKAAANVRLL